MLFNSYAFLFVFLPATLLAFYGLRRFGWLGSSVPALTIASILFYAYWRPQDTPILLGSIAFNFLVSREMGRSGERRSRLLLALGICGDLGVLFYFKYFNFVAANLATAGGVSYMAHAIIMPIGISFFTFTQIAYLVDCFRSRSSEPKLLNYALFVTIFPHLIAGPIIHHAQMRPQFVKITRETIDPELIKMGVLIFVIGLVKKVLFADNLVSGADAVFNGADHGLAPGLAGAWIGVVSYTLQIYFDFSGYSDMAIGLALLFGLRLPVNFDSPYKSRSIIEFWRRWHITLSTWLRDYLYIPLGGNRHGELARLRNIFITMLLGGLWHGAGWTFIIWGALHGGYIVVNHALHIGKKAAPRAVDSRAVGIGKQAVTLFLVMVAWVFFRAPSVPSAMVILQSMFTGSGPASAPLAFGPAVYFWLVAGTAIALLAPNTQQLARYSDKLTDTLHLGPGAAPMAAFSWKLPRLSATPLTAILFGLMFAAAFAQLWRPTIFIYFNF